MSIYVGTMALIDSPGDRSRQMTTLPRYLQPASHARKTQAVASSPDVMTVSKGRTGGGRGTGDFVLTAQSEPGWANHRGLLHRTSPPSTFHLPLPYRILNLKSRSIGQSEAVQYARE